jgi:hypothetical protein
MFVIAMSFISWMMAIMMWLGFSIVSLWEYDLNNPNSKTDDLSRATMQITIEEYHNSGFAGKVTKIMFFGALSIAMFLGVITGRNKLDE